MEGGSRMQMKCRSCGGLIDVEDDASVLECAACGGSLAPAAPTPPPPPPPPPVEPAPGSVMAQTPYRCPEDAEAQRWLDSQGGFADTLRHIYATQVEPLERTRLHGNALRVSPNQFPELWGLHTRCCRRLGMPPLDLFIEGDDDINAFAQGVGQCRIVLTSTLAEMFSHGELAYVLGHEIAHVACQHTLLNLTRSHMLEMLEAQAVQAHESADASAYRARQGFRAGGVVGIGFGLVNAAVATNQRHQGNAHIAHMESLLQTATLWDHVSEISADRGGLVCCREATHGISALVKMVVRKPALASRVNIQEYLQQGNQIDDPMALGGTHPPAVIRARAMHDYANTDHFRWVASVADRLDQASMAAAPPPPPS